MRLPQPPNNSEMLLYTDQNKNGLYFYGIGSLLALLVGMAMFIVQHDGLFIFWIFWGMLLAYLGSSYAVGILGHVFDIRLHAFKMHAAFNYQPTIDVYLPCCGEPLNVLKNTYEHVSRLKYTKDLLKVYVLDDKNDQRVKLLADKYGFEYIARQEKGYLKKAGNIRYAFARTHGEFILILDADFAPRTDFLDHTIPYFADSTVAIVQTPQFFDIKDQDSWIQKGASYIQELFYRLIQVNRSTWNASVCVGTCAVYRRSALAPHGGTAPIAYSEDLHTGFQAYKDGYKIVYVPLNLSKGLCPDNFSGFMNQQYRWCTGSFSLFLNKHFWEAKMPAMARISYLTGMLYYIASALGVIVTPLPSLIMFMCFPDGVKWYNTLFAIPSFLYGTAVIAMWSKHPWGVYAILSRQASYWAHLLAIYDKLKGKTVAWVPTGEVSIKKTGARISDRAAKLMYAWAFLSSALMIIFAILRARTGYSFTDFVPAILFSIFNSVVTVMAAGD